MKKYQLFLLTMVVCLLAFCGVALADICEDDLTALQEADSFDTQLAVLDKIVAENADRMECGCRDLNYKLNVAAAPGVPEGLDPKGLNNVCGKDIQGRKFIALYYRDKDSEPKFAGDILACFPADMRAKSLEEAECALIVYEQLVPSGYVYSPPASSYHRDYTAYIVDLETGDATRIWQQRNNAKTSGWKGQLDGNWFNNLELWLILRPKLFGELRYTQPDGTVLLFDICGESCSLTGCEGELTELDVPASVDGYAVIEIADKAFMDEGKLTTVTLPEGLRYISNNAFENCVAIERLELPDTLDSIGSSIINDCSRLARIVFGEGITELPNVTFFGCRKLACCYFPASLTKGLSDQSSIDEYTTIYAPEGSYALQWAAENGYDHVICDDPDEMPDIEYVTEGDFEFLIFRGEAAVSSYLGSDADVIVPEMAGDVPVTRVLNEAFNELPFLQSVTLPQSINIVYYYAISDLAKEGTLHLYVTNPETAFLQLSVCSHYGSKIIMIHAPEGSLAERYVIDSNEKNIVFEAWDGGVTP